MPSYKNLAVFRLYFLCPAFRFLSSVKVVRASFLGTRLCKHQNSAFALSKFLGILSSLFSSRSTWQTSIPAFSFSQAYILHIRANFFTSNLDSQHSASALSITDHFFHFLPLKKAYNAELTCRRF